MKNSESVQAEPALLDIRGAAALLGLTSWQIRGLISNKELPIVRVGSKFYFRRATLTRWAERAEGKHKAA
jgi:excisionase family DNA binding protein